MLIRQNLTGRILTRNGRILTGKLCCFQVYIYAGHPGCVDMVASDGRTIENLGENRYRFPLDWGIFELLVRWTEGHSPYPEIEDMEILVLGQNMGIAAYPKEPASYKKVCTVKIRHDGIFLNDKLVVKLY